MKRFALAFALLVVALAGCSKGGPMVGTWKFEVSPEMAKLIPAGQKPEMSAEFKGDGTFEMKQSGGGKSSTAKGTYKLEEKKLTLTITEVDGKPAPAGTATPMPSTLSDDQKSFDMMGMGKMVKQ